MGTKLTTAPPSARYTVSPDTLLGNIFPTGCQLSPEGIVVILDLLVVLNTLVDVVLPRQGCHLLLQFCFPLLQGLKLLPLLLGHSLCLPQLLLHCLESDTHASLLGLSSWCL